MPEYTVLTQDEKLQIKEATIRNLEFMMYQLDLQLVAENVKEDHRLPIERKAEA